mmetsp:Transcript_2113/g.5712  ORF Transcript_2113/g.5712 Transcript_2113/m.5712 type:complete len:317 (-) Transcript_2113:19-969(-)
MRPPWRRPSRLQAYSRRRRAGGPRHDAAAAAGHGRWRGQRGGGDAGARRVASGGRSLARRWRQAQADEDLLKVIVLQTALAGRGVDLDASCSRPVKLADVIVHQQYTAQALRTELPEVPRHDELLYEACLALQADCLPQQGAIEILHEASLAEGASNGQLAALGDDAKHHACVSQRPQARRQQRRPLVELELLAATLCTLAGRGRERTVKVEEHGTHVARNDLQVAADGVRSPRRHDVPIGRARRRRDAHGLRQPHAVWEDDAVPCPLGRGLRVDRGRREGDVHNVRRPSPQPSGGQRRDPDRRLGARLLNGLHQS